PSLEFYVQTPLITIYIKPFLAIPINVALAFLVLFPYIFIIILFALLIGIYYVDIRRITASFKNLIRKGTH
uniref:hypothetical protein n=1 Tax=Vulcanisaeta distributa TaxID=164451 RepID=UPI000A4E340F